MNIALFGANGRTGTRIAAQALGRGDRVTAVVRDAASMSPRDGLTVVETDVTKPAELADSIEGHDVVVSAVGSRESGPTTVCTDISRSILQAMTQVDVRRLVAVSASGFHTDGDGPLTKALVKPMLKRMLRHAFADMQEMERIVMASAVDWTLMRPPMLTEDRLTKSYRSAYGVNVRRGMRISRADLAHAILGAADDPAAVHRAVSVAN